MEYSGSIHYFVDANSSAGYVDRYESAFGGLKQVEQLCDFPDETAERLLFYVQNKAAEKNLRTEVIHNCLTNRPMGILLPELSRGVINRQTWRPGALSALASLDNAALNGVRSALSQAWSYFGKARLVHDEWEKIYIENLDFTAADALAEETCARLFGGERGREGGGAVERFFGAATCRGPVDYIQNLTAGLERRFFIKGRPGTGKSTLLKKLAAAAREGGFFTEIYRCSLDPNSYDMVVVRGLGLCVFDSTAPHEYFPEREGDQVIDIYDAAVRPGTDEKYAAQLARLEGRYQSLVKQARECLLAAKEGMEDFQREALPRFSPGALAGLQEGLAERLFASGPAA